MIMIALYCCCLWWSSHDMDISKRLGSSTATGLRFYQQRLTDSSWCQPSTSLHDPFSPEPSTAPEAASSPVASHSAKPRLFSMTPSCLQNQYHMRDSQTTKVSCPCLIQPWPALEFKSVLYTVRKHFPEDVTSEMLISNHCQFQQLQPTQMERPSQAKVRYSSPGVLLITAESSAPAHHNHRILIQNKWA